jgi:hypothetical protein
MKLYGLLTPLALVAALLTGCAAPELPPNVTTTGPAGGAAYIDRIDFSYTRPTPADFAHLKLCVAQTVQNGEAVLHDSSGSFVGHTGTYYRADSHQIAGGGQVFKYVDDAAATAIVDGMTVAPASGGAISGNYVRYELKATTGSNSVGLVFYNLTQAQQSTGMLANDGFSPVGVWAGSRADAIYAAIAQVANNIKGCVQ